MGNLESRWNILLEKIKIEFNKEKLPDIDAFLFLIGIRELGKIKNEFTKEEKQDLMHIAVCRLLSDEGYYELEFQDEEGWPHWKAINSLPKMSMDEQENLLKEKIILYFEEIY